MFDRSLAAVAGVLVLASGFGIGVLITAFTRNHTELAGALIAWYAVSLGCAALLMWPREN